MRAHVTSMLGFGTRQKAAAALGAAILAIVALLAVVTLRPSAETVETGLRSDVGPVPSIESASLSIPDIVEAVEPSIVRVKARYADSDGSASGLVYSADGHILTNWHAVDGASQIDVELYDRGELPATLVREDPRYDMAILRVDANGLHAAEFGDSDQLRVGEDVVSIGHSLGFGGGPSVSRGIIGGLDRTVADNDGKLLTHLIQTDAAIDQGSSGGALVDSEGKVIGINIGLSTAGQGANFALAANRAVESADELVHLGKRPPPGYLGVGGIDVTPTLARLLQLPVQAGFGVRYVDPDSPAATAELMVDDIIVGIDNTVIRSQRDFTEFLKTHPEGADVVVTAVRPDAAGGTTLEIAVTLASPGA